MCAADQVWNPELTLIHKNIRSVRNLHAQELIVILKIIGRCDVKHILTSLIKTIMPVTYIITSITARQTCCDTSDNVCLYLQNCCHSTYIHVPQMYM
jgi:hypothetical protein